MENDGNTYWWSTTRPDVVRSVHDLLRLGIITWWGPPSAGHWPRSAWQAQRVHIVMADQRMPDMTGWSFLSGAAPTNPARLRLLFTGYADINGGDRLPSTSGTSYVTSPNRVTRMNCRRSFAQAATQL